MDKTTPRELLIASLAQAASGQSNQIMKGMINSARSMFAFTTEEAAQVARICAVDSVMAFAGIKGDITEESLPKIPEDIVTPEDAAQSLALVDMIENIGLSAFDDLMTYFKADCEQQRERVRFVAEHNANLQRAEQVDANEKAAPAEEELIDSDD